jgi:hypothetical protein
MRFRHEIYGHLSRLLATENITVEHKNVETASFDVLNRVLILPLWSNASDDVYQMLCCHEVSHSLWTPNTDWTELTSVPMAYLNIAEDARVEKLMKRKYPGSKKTFFNAYKELQEKDFFDIASKDVNSMSLADRINLYFKVGNFIDIEFTEKENELLEMISNEETFEDAINCAELLYAYCKEEQQEKVSVNIDSLKAEGEGSGSGESMNVSSTQDNSQSGSQNESEKSQSIQDNDSDSRKGSQSSTEKTEYFPGGSGSKEPQVSTVGALNRAINNLVDHSLKEITYVEIPNLDLGKIIIPNKKIHSACKSEWNNQCPEYFESVDRDYMKFKKSTRAEVNYLIKEFECKKSADLYSRTTESKTGVLDCSLLYSYKYNNEIFKKVSVIPEGKNHGLIFILDWSGSMDHVLVDTIKQLYNLIWFCRKLSIPFDVYAFTSYWGNQESFHDEVPGYIKIDSHFKLMQFFTSSVSSSVLDLQMKNIYRIAYANTYSGRCYYNTPSQLSLSGTPLNESLVTLHSIIGQFKKKTKVQKVQCVVLTDGEASALSYIVEKQNMYSNGVAGIGENCFLRDRKLKTTYHFPPYNYYSTHKFSDVLLRHLRDSHPDTNFIGIRLLGNGESTSFIKQHSSDNQKEYQKAMNDWSSNRSCSIHTSGYHSYFGIHSNSIRNNNEFEVKEDATSTEIKNAFQKSLKHKKTNKKILSEFADLIS